MKLIIESWKRFINESTEREEERMFDIVYDSEPGDLIYQTIPRLQQMLVVIKKHIAKNENEYHEGGHDEMWAVDNIEPLYKMYEKVEEAIEIANDMGFGET